MWQVVLLIIAFFLFLFVAWRRLTWALAIISLFLPVYIIRFQIWFIPFTFLEALILAVFLVWFIKVVVKKEKIEWSNFKWVISMFLLVGIVAILISPDKRAALGIYKAYFIEPILLFLVFINTIKTESQVKLILYALGCSSLFVSLLALEQYLGLWPGIEPYISEIPKRATSFFPFPTAVGKFLAPIMSIFLAFVMVNKEKIIKPIFPKLFIWGVILFSLIGLLVSMTRGAFLGIFSAFIFLSFFNKYKKWFWLSILIVVVLVFVVPITREQATSVFKGTDTSTDVHIVMWKGTVRLLKARPIQGAGLAGFPIIYNIYRDPAHVELFPYPDNFYLAVWTELGLAGLVAFLWLIIRFFKESAVFIRKKITSNFYYQLVLGLMAFMICILIHGMVDTPYFKNDLSVMFWIFVGILVVIKKIELDRTKG